MYLHSKLLGALLSAAVVYATSPFNNGVRTVVESIKIPPKPFIASGPAPTPADTTIQLRIALAQNNAAGLEGILRDVSTPGSENYGKWLSREEVVANVQPSHQTWSLVTDWLSSYSVTAKNASFAGDWLEIAVPVLTANEIFGADFKLFENTDTGVKTLRTLSYSIPATLQGHIALVHPTVNFPTSGALPPKNAASTDEVPLAKNPALPASCQTAITPTCIQDLYGVPATPVSNPHKQSLYVAEYEGNNIDNEDLNTFLTLYRPDINPNTTFATISVDNGTNDDSPYLASFEGCLDFEYTIGIATGVPVTLLVVGPTYYEGNETESNLAFWTAILDSALYIADAENPPTIVTISYGADETTLSPALAKSICNAYLLAGLRGTSVMFASGDGGVGGFRYDIESPGCEDGVFVPSFPGTCPYITAVGATQLGLGNSTETTVNFTQAVWTTSGGFSAYFDRAWYQELAVAPYVAGLGNTYEGLYNGTGRGFPDVSAVGYNYSVVCFTHDDEGYLGGTSASSPTFASIVSYLNDARISAGKPTLGFLNPLLYTIPEAFTDITEGNIGVPGCNTSGFYAEKGWDAATGLGTPIFEKLKAAVLLF